jgi:hypothetical protein
VGDEESGTGGERLTKERVDKDKSGTGGVGRVVQLGKEKKWDW